MSKTGKYFFIGLLVLSSANVFALRRWIDIDLELRTEWIGNRVQDGWKVQDAGDPQGINKDFSYSQGVSSATPAGWRGEIQEIFTLNLAAHPYRRITFDVGFEFLGNHADRLWQPISDRKRMELEGTKFKWVTGLIDYRSEFIKLRGFRGVGNNSWVDTDIDLFNFYPEQFETDRYRRISGRIVPQGFSAEVGNQSLGRLTYISGNELVWGFGPSHYAKYHKHWKRLDTAVFFKSENIPYGVSGEKLNAWQLSTLYRAHRRVKVRTGLIFQPFRLHELYQYTEDAAPGSGLLGSTFRVKTGRTELADAWGEALEVTISPKRVIDTLVIGVKHRGLVAGNKDEGSIYGRKKFLSGTLSNSLRFTAVRPVQDPMPLLKDSAGSIVASPRGEFEPFRVTEDPHVPGDWGNREKNIFDYVISYDPTPRTWLYRWRDEVVEPWNINPAEDAKVAAVFHLRLAEYPGSTDRIPYFNEQGELTFPPAHFTGLPPSKGYMPSFKVINITNLPGKYQLIVGLSGGQIPATTALAEENSTLFTNYFTADLAVRRGPLSVELGYERDTFGPEDFHRDFGETIDRLFRSRVAYEFGDWALTSVEYLYARRKENLDRTFSLGSFDEIRVAFTLRFGVLLLVDEHAPRMSYVEEKKRSVPAVRLAVDDMIFSPDGDGVQDTVRITLDVRAGGIESWMMTILDDTERAVQVLPGRGMPPAFVVWDGIDQDFDATVGEGVYTIYFNATNKQGRRGSARPLEIRVQY